MEDLPATPKSGSDGGTTLARDWQKRLAARTAPPPTEPWWQDLLKSRAAVAVGAAVAALLILAIARPPLVQKTSDTAFESATLSVLRLLVWSALVGGAVYAAPYAWAALQNCGS